MDLRISVIVNSLATRWNFRWQHVMLFGLRMPLMCSTTTDVLRKCHWNIVLVTLSPFTTYYVSLLSNVGPWTQWHLRHVGCIIFLRKHIDKKNRKACTFLLFDQIASLFSSMWGAMDTMTLPGTPPVTRWCITGIGKRVLFFIECPICVSYLFSSEIHKKVEEHVLFDQMFYRWSFLFFFRNTWCVVC